MIKTIATVGAIGTVAAAVHLTTPALATITVIAVVAAAVVITVVRMLLRACHRTSSTQPGSFDVGAFTDIIDAITRLVRGPNGPIHDDDPNDPAESATGPCRRRRERRWTPGGFRRRRDPAGDTDSDSPDSRRR